jgi:hypothetical protein
VITLFRSSDKRHPGFRFVEHPFEVPPPDMKGYNRFTTLSRHMDLDQLTKDERKAVELLGQEIETCGA